MTLISKLLMLTRKGVTSPGLSVFLLGFYIHQALICSGVGHFFPCFETLLAAQTELCGHMVPFPESSEPSIPDVYIILIVIDDAYFLRKKGVIGLIHYDNLSKEFKRQINVIHCMSCKISTKGGCTIIF